METTRIRAELETNKNNKEYEVEEEEKGRRS